MRYQLREHGWPLGPFLVPQGTIIDTSVNDGWSRLVALSGFPPPRNAQPLDQATYDLMRQQFAAWEIITVPGADGIIRN